MGRTCLTRMGPVRQSSLPPYITAKLSIVPSRSSRAAKSAASYRMTSQVTARMLIFSYLVPRWGGPILSHIPPDPRILIA